MGTGFFISVGFGWILFAFSVRPAQIFELIIILFLMVARILPFKGTRLTGETMTTGATLGAIILGGETGGVSGSVLGQQPLSELPEGLGGVGGSCLTSVMGTRLSGLLMSGGHSRGMSSNFDHWTVE